MRLPIRVQLLRSTAVPVTVVFVILALVLSVLRDQAIDALKAEGNRTAAFYTKQLSARFRTAATLADATAAAVQADPQPSEEQLYQLLASTLRIDSLVAGAGLAFEPGAFATDRKLFAPYVQRRSDGPQRLDLAADGTDYTADHDGWYRRPKQTDRPGWSEPHHGASGPASLIITYSAPFHRAGKFAGVATIDLPVNNIGRLLGVDAGLGELVIITTADGRYIAHPNPDRIMRDNLQELAKASDSAGLKAFAKGMLSGGSGLLRVAAMPELKPEPHFIFHRLVPETGWRFAVAMPESAVLARVHRNGILVGTALFVTMATLLLVIWFVAQSVSRPIESLTAAARTLADGRWETRLSTARHDELGELAQAFNDMAQALGERERALQKERQRRFGQLLDGLTGKYFYYTRDHEGHITHVSPSVATILGHEPEDFISLGAELLPETPINHAALDIRRASTRGEQQSTFGLDMLHHDGRVRRLEVYERPLHDDSGQLTGVEGMACDITDRLAQDTGDTVFFSRRSGNDMVCVSRTSGSFPVKTLITDVGLRRPLGAGASGLAVLSAMPQDEASGLIEANTPAYAAQGRTADQVRKDVAAARRAGHVERDIPALGARTISAPLRDPSGRPFGSISISSISQRMSGEHLASSLDALLKAVAEVERRVSVNYSSHQQ